VSNVLRTHEVTNQAPPLCGYDVFGADDALVEALGREADSGRAAELHDLGRLAGGEQAQTWARQAEGNPPTLRTHDRYGHRIDVVDYHPAYHELMAAAVGHGLHAAPWSDDGPAPHATRAAKVLVWYQVDGGHVCPVSMTYSALPALRHAPQLATEWEPRLTSPTYDPSDGPAAHKSGATAGMAMTEKQGGSDVRANTTRARHVTSGEYRLTGHKWFCSAPMSDGFLMLAQAPGGLSCFWVPRWCPDTTRNPIAIQRLKDKLGDRANASSEIELLDTYGHLVGEEGRGIATIIEMVSHTRLDCTLGSTALMRQATAQATWHATHRRAFGALLVDQPLMANVLADLALESEAATVAAMRLARTFDAAPDDEHEVLLRRLLTPVLKYWTCKRAPVLAAEALECLGGSGFVEESGLPRVYRQSPVNGIWEGSGNVICLDVLRALGRSPFALEALWAEIGRAAGADRRLDDALSDLKSEVAGLDVADRPTAEGGARRLVEHMALVLQGSLLVRHAPAAVADGFCASRLAGDRGAAFGTLPADVDTAAIVRRALPH
jgi:putative acyl-CoA dehydrogenase